MTSEQTLISNVSRIAKIPQGEITMDMEVYNSKLISSLALLELMSFIEKEYNIVIKSEELIADNFRDLATLKQFIEKKLQQSSIRKTNQTFQPLQK
ncbi:MAG: acyl carrier protein [bacterium]